MAKVEKKKRTADRDTSPRRRDPDRTKATLLATATKIFSEHGFVGGSISKILEDSGVNKRMIYHYFGDKDGLYRAVLTQQWEDMHKWMGKALEGNFEASDVDDRKLLFMTLDGFFEFLISHREFVRLLMWDGLLGGAMGIGIWDQARAPIFGRIEELIRVSQKRGIIDSQLSPAHFIITFMGAATFYFAYAETMRKMIRQEPWSENALKERKEQLFLQLKRMLIPDKSDSF